MAVVSSKKDGWRGSKKARFSATKSMTYCSGTHSPFTRIPVVIGEYLDETRPVFEEKAKEMQVPILFAQDLYAQEEKMKSGEKTRSSIEMGSNVELGNVEMELKGSYQERNRKTILAALNVLHQTMTISDEAIRNGFEHVCELTGLRGRWEKLGEAPLVICDTGHNLAGWKYLATQQKQDGSLRCIHR